MGAPHVDPDPVRRSALVRVVLACTVLLSLGACRDPGASSGGSAPPLLLTPSPQITATAPASRISPRLAPLLAPDRKYFGLAVDGAPISLSSVSTFAHRVHKTPNLVEYFQDWTHPFDVGAAQQICASGAVSELTWESWSWENIANGETAFSQPAYSPRKIASGFRDAYVRETARAIRAVHCPLILRFDQEPNGRWYPWGVGTPGMHNTAAGYVAMWRHVWRVFRAQHVRNVIWQWSPNLLYPGGIDRLAALYPGDAYVDMVGIDGYIVSPTDTPATVFGPVMQRLDRVVPNKPWLIAETGAAAGPDQARNIASLLEMVASSDHLIGMVYLNLPVARADWRITASKASLKAFRRGINIPAYAAAAR